MAKAKIDEKDNLEQLKIEVVGLDNVKPEYSNYVQITHSPYEFVINFCYIDKAKSGDKKTFAEAVSRIVISPSLMPSIIKAFQVNFEKYNAKIKQEIEMIKKERRGKK